MNQTNNTWQTEDSVTNFYCKAPWTSTCYMPDGKYSPCCAYNGKYFDSPQEIIDTLGEQFKQGILPRACATACPINEKGWRQTYEKFNTDYQSLKIQYLDFRNSNLCNMKCRSCGPAFSTSWAQEIGDGAVLKHKPLDLTCLDLSQCREIYFAGGEPMLNPQHYELLQYLLDHDLDPVLMYSTNMSVLGYKQLHISHYWQHFSRINVNASIDAVGKYAEFVRTGTVWSDIQTNIAWVKQQKNLILRFCPVISAINIWWIDELFEYIRENISQDHQFQPVLASNHLLSIGIIPLEWRQPLIDKLRNCPWLHLNINTAIRILETVDTSQAHWRSFLTKQVALDSRRSEHWFDNLPIKNELVKYLAIHHAS